MLLLVAWFSKIDRYSFSLAAISFYVTSLHFRGCLFHVGLFRGCLTSRLSTSWLSASCLSNLAAIYVATVYFLFSNLADVYIVTIYFIVI